MSTTFAAWVRGGVAAAGPNLLTPATDAARLEARLRASVNGVAAPPVDVTVLGPQDVTGLDPGQIVRTDPQSGAEGFETTRFASIEFKRADLPWLFTPLLDDPRLPPWIVLVVVPATECELRPRTNAVPVLVVDQAQLPPPDEAWAWAHVQVPSATGGAIPAASRSRLVCPRQLRAFTRYLAAVVPAFEAGRLGGLGQAPVATSTLAWSAGASGTLELPAYHHWFFSTGAAGDFESLARGLVALDEPPDGVGIARLDVSAPGPAALASPGRVTDLLGALAAPGSTVGSWPSTDRAALAAVLAPSPAARVLAPPAYGALAADVAGTPETGIRRWIGQLNLHPAFRAAAGAGAAIVRRRQHDFVQEAWEQAGDVEDANRRLDRARLGRRVSGGIERRHVTPRDAVDLVGFAGPVLARLPHRIQPRTLAASLGVTRLPAATFSAEFRRLLRPTGPLARRGVGDAIRHQLIEGLGAGTLEPDRSRTGRPGGLVTLGGLVDVVAAARGSGLRGAPITVTPGISATQPRPRPVRVDVRHGDPAIPGGGVAPPGAGPVTTIRISDPSGIVGGTTTVRLGEDHRVPTLGRLGNLDLESLTTDTLGTLPGTVLLDLGSGPVDLTAAVREGLMDFVGSFGDETRAPAVDLAGIAAQLRVDLAPTRTIPAAVWLTVDRPAAGAGADELEPVMVAPRIDEPLWDDLAELGADLFLPGADALAQEHATILATNPRYVAAFLAGANEEMMRELRWRDYPTDGRGTVFHRFWDRRDEAGDVSDDLLEAVDGWRNDLGADLAGPTGELVLVIRSDLFRRYPGTIVTAVPAIAGTPRRPDDTRQTAPSFHGTLPRGAAFFGFPISIADAVGVTGDGTKPGWFICFHQPPTDLGFGVDDPQPEDPGDPPAWLDPTSFGADGAAVARSTAQLPIRLAIHASDLARRPGGS